MINRYRRSAVALAGAALVAVLAPATASATGTFKGTFGDVRFKAGRSG